MSNELQSGILAIVEAYRERWAHPQAPPGPLILPDWLPDAWAREHPNDDLDKVCRDYGFDGWTTASESW